MTPFLKLFSCVTVGADVLLEILIALILFQWSKTDILSLIALCIPGIRTQTNRYDYGGCIVYPATGVRRKHCPGDECTGRRTITSWMPSRFNWPLQNKRHHHVILLWVLVLLLIIQYIMKPYAPSGYNRVDIGRQCSNTEWGSDTGAPSTLFSICMTVALCESRGDSVCLSVID